MRRIALVIAGIMVFGARAAAARAETGKAVIRGTSEGSTVRGEAVVRETPEGLNVSVRITGAPPGMHGFHVHALGSCDDHGNAAGGHFNPDGVAHGFLPKDGLVKAHAGDFGNLQVGPDGQGSLDLTLPGLSLSAGKYGVDGRAVILHEKADDFGQPTGNAGSRIGCGIIEVSQSLNRNE